jgi:hypothetical protein
MYYLKGRPIDLPSAISLLGDTNQLKGIWLSLNAAIVGKK